jgi:hypothetical protein
MFGSRLDDLSLCIQRRLNSELTIGPTRRLDELADRHLLDSRQHLLRNVGLSRTQGVTVAADAHSTKAALVGG